MCFFSRLLLRVRDAAEVGILQVWLAQKGVSLKLIILTQLDQVLRLDQGIILDEVLEERAYPFHIEHSGALAPIFDHTRDHASKQVCEEDVGPVRVSISDVEDRERWVPLTEVVEEFTSAKVRLAFSCDKENVPALSHLF